MHQPAGGQVREDEVQDDQGRASDPAAPKLSRLRLNPRSEGRKSSSQKVVEKVRGVGWISESW